MDSKQCDFTRRVRARPITKMKYLILRSPRPIRRAPKIPVWSTFHRLLLLAPIFGCRAMWAYKHIAATLLFEIDFSRNRCSQKKWLFLTLKTFVTFVRFSRRVGKVSSFSAHPLVSPIFNS